MGDVRSHESITEIPQTMFMNNGREFAGRHAAVSGDVLGSEGDAHGDRYERVREGKYADCKLFMMVVKMVDNGNDCPC